jgi:hypothetical protein
VANCIKGLLRDRFFVSILHQSQGDAATSDVKGDMVSGANRCVLVGRVRDDGPILAVMRTTEIWNIMSRWSVEDIQDLPDKSLITVTVIVSKQN